VKPTDAGKRRRRTLLLLSAILIPSAVVITLGIRLVRQETELGEKRLAEERRDASGQLHRNLQSPRTFTAFEA
jgi:hypothetical protein